MVEHKLATAQSQWYAVHTRSRHEKLVANGLRGNGIPCFLPLVERRRRWSDRYMHVQEPLFPGYLFVYMLSDHRIRVLQTRGVVQLVGGEGGHWPIPEDEIQAIRVALASDLKIDPYPYLRVGREVRVTRGPLKGHTGILVRKQKRHRLVVSVHLIGRSIAVEIDTANVSAN